MYTTKMINTLRRMSRAVQEGRPTSCKYDAAQSKLQCLLLTINNI